MATRGGKRAWVLTDISQRIWVESLDLESGEMGLGDLPGVSIRKYTLRGGICDGVDMIEVRNGAMSFTVVPTRGMGIWKGEYKGVPIGWNAPLAGPVHPKFVHLADRGGLGWLEGFDECIVRCGLESNGAPGTDVLPNNMGQPVPVELNLHGRIANTPASRVGVEVVSGRSPELCVVGVVDESMLFCPQLRLVTRISTRVGSNSVTISDEVLNLRGTTGEMELLYHCNFGKPFLGRGSRLLVPASETAPRDARAAEGIGDWASYKAPTAGFVEQAFWHTPLGDSRGDTVTLLENAARNRGVAVRFNVGRLPCFTQWKNTAAESDGYVTGLEPGTNYPNNKAFERKHGRVVILPPGGKYRADITVEVHDTAAGVARVEREILRIQRRQKRTVYGQPIEKYSSI